MIDLFAEIFRATPLCHVINDEALLRVQGLGFRVQFSGMVPAQKPTQQELQLNCGSGNPTVGGPH